MPSKSETPPKAPRTTEDLEFLVNARFRNQQVLSKLWLFASDQALKEPSVWNIYAFLVGAGFALWRAAFLLDLERTAEQIMTGTRELLRALVEDNAVGYQQERTTREFMCGFHINNALFRIRHAYRDVIALGGEYARGLAESSRYQELRRSLPSVPEGGASLKQYWRMAHDSIEELLEQLERGTKGVRPTV